MTPALLMVTMEPPAALEEEFHDWYDTEHLPQRRALPGFRSATRWVCLDGWPRWLAVYELEERAALSSEPYRAVSAERSTPWSRRLLPRTIGRSRVVADERAPLPTTFDDPAIVRLLVTGVRVAESDADAVAEAVAAGLARCDGLMFVRGFLEPSNDGPPTLWQLAAFDSVVSARALAGHVGRPAGHPVKTFNLHAPYRRSGY